MMFSRVTVWCAISLVVIGCASPAPTLPTPVPSVLTATPGPGPGTNTASPPVAAPAPPPTPTLPTLSIVADSQLGFDLYAAGNTLFVVAPQPYLTRVLFAVAEADGLREVPELAQGLDLGKHVQTIERLVGTWPGTLWLQTLDVDPEKTPEDPDWTSRFFRHDAAGWKALRFKSNARYPIVWVDGPNCLVGLQGGSRVKGTKRVAADCPGRRAPVVQLDDVRDAYRMSTTVTSPAGDVGVLEESADPPRFRVEILGNQDVPKRSTAPIPLPVAVDAYAMDFVVGPKSLVIHSTSNAYLGGILKPRGGAAPGKDASIFFRFDGNAWAVLETPPLTDVPLFTVAEDGTVILAVPSAGKGDEDFSLWFLPPKGSWEKRYTFRNPVGPSLSHPYQIWARSTEDIWVACSTPENGSYRMRVVHTGEKKAVWRPTKEAAH